jgi:[citrate (pro-3S)-lyase] ligase
MEVKKRQQNKNSRIGAIVMNANPFTYGHLHLAKYASECVDSLLIFVVEEDRSYFPFDLRLQMVKDGVESLKNAIVLSSGESIISKNTMPGYFTKETYSSELDDLLHYKKDICIFGAKIAPELGIKIRFLGEEPKDGFTKGYNEALKSILPTYYGIEVREIKRRKLDGEVISASAVRKNIENGKWNKVKELVPPTTWKLLMESNIQISGETF